jgi:choline dehydrogenase-like flavoprotein
MSSCGVVNPSLTFMALTARAANHAVEQLRAERPVVAKPDDGAAMP